MKPKVFGPCMIVADPNDVMIDIIELIPPDPTWLAANVVSAPDPNEDPQPT